MNTTNKEYRLLWVALVVALLFMLGNAEQRAYECEAEVNETEELERD